MRRGSGGREVLPAAEGLDPLGAVEVEVDGRAALGAGFVVEFGGEEVAAGGADVAVVGADDGAICRCDVE